jgi:hypothetical protein
MGEKQKAQAIVDAKKKYTSEVAAIDKLAEAKIIENKKRQKAAQFAEATINIATGVTKAWSQGGGIFGPALAAIVAAAGAAQLATIASQKFAKGGWVTGYGNGDTVHAELTPGEFVLTKEDARVLQEYPFSRNSSSSSSSQTSSVQLSVVYSPFFSSASPGDMVMFSEAVIKALEQAGVSVG